MVPGNFFAFDCPQCKSFIRVFFDLEKDEVRIPLEDGLFEYPTPIKPSPTDIKEVLKRMERRRALCCPECVKKAQEVFSVAIADLSEELGATVEYVCPACGKTLVISYKRTSKGKHK